MNRRYYPISEYIYRIQCPHHDKLSLESPVYCASCQSWIDGEEVGDFQIIVERSGKITAQGGGYVDGYKQGES